jgi:hypothetical protein
MTNSIPQEGKLERITRRWWFYGLFVLMQFTIPPYASKGYKIEDWGNVIMHALSNAIVHQYSELYPIFKVIPIILLVCIFVFRNKVGRLFAIYVSISYMLFAIGQNIAITEKYGITICTINLVMFPLVAVFWAWEAVVLKNDYSLGKLPIWRYWVVPLAVLAFWAPSGRGGLPDFNPVLLFTNGAGVAFCMMTPVYVGLLTLYWPRINLPAMRVTSLVGLIIGLYNMYGNFGINPARRWWNGILHIPLLVISLYGLILSLKRPKVEKQTDENIESAER